MMEYFRDDDLRSPVPDTELSQLEKDLGLDLPADYREFLLLSDGYNGYVGAKGYAHLWSIRELTSYNEGYEVRSNVPDLTLIGSNGGPTAYGIDLHEGRVAFVSIPFAPMARDEIRQLGGTFVEFLAALSAGEGW